MGSELLHWGLAESARGADVEDHVSSNAGCLAGFLYSALVALGAAIQGAPTAVWGGFSASAASFAMALFLLWRGNPSLARHIAHYFPALSLAWVGLELGGGAHLASLPLTFLPIALRDRKSWAPWGLYVGALSPFALALGIWAVGKGQLPDAGSLVIGGLSCLSAFANIVIFFELTAQRTGKRERSLAAEREELELAQEEARIAGWELVLGKEALLLSPGARALLKSAAEDWGSTRAPLPVARLLALCVEEDRQKLARFLEESARGKQPATLEFRIRTGEDGERWMRVGMRFVRRPDGRIRRCLGSLQDVSERRRIEASVADTERLLETYSRSIDRVAIVAILDDHGMIASANDAFCRASGYRREEVLGHSWSRHLDSQAAPEAAERMWKTLRSGWVWKAETPCLKKSGRSYVVDETIIPMPPEEGRAAHFLCIRFDVTARKALERELQEKTLFLEAVLAAIPDPVFVKNQRHEWIMFNQQFADFLGRPMDELIGRDDRAFFPEEQVQVFWKKDDEVFDDGVAIESEELLTDQNGSLHMISTKKSPFTLPDGKRYLVGIIRDITAIRAAESEAVTRREEVEAILRALPDLYVRIDAEGNVRDARGMTESNVASMDIVGQRISNAFSMGAESILMPAVQRAIESREPATAEYVLSAMDGALRSFEARVAPFRGNEAVAICRDVSAQRETISLLRNSEARTKRVLDSLPLAVFVLDNAGGLTFGNRRAEMLFGSALQGLSGLPVADPLRLGTMRDSGLPYPVEQLPLERALRGEASQIDDIEIRLGGERLPLQVTGAPVFDQDGLLEYAIAVVEDMSERLSNERRLKQQELLLFQASKMAGLGEMAGGLAHEINNPLAIIYGRAQQILGLLQRGENAPERLVPLVEKIMATVNRISRIIDGLRSFARDGARDAPEAADIRVIVRETVELCQARFHSKAVQLRQAEITGDVVFECRAVQIEQVLLNLLNNAYDAVCDLGDERRWVEIRVRNESDRLVICVLDGGPGVSPEIEARIFEPFFTTKEVGKGTGLGLSISKGIVEGHGGRMYIDRESADSAFTLELPRKVPRGESQKAA